MNSIKFLVIDLFDAIVIQNNKKLEINANIVLKYFDFLNIGKDKIIYL